MCSFDGFWRSSRECLGLALGFGSQGIVQDVVTGLTLIFSDLIDVGAGKEFLRLKICIWPNRGGPD